MNKQRGFFLVDWVADFFDGPIITVALKFVLVVLLGLGVWRVGPAFTEAYETHKVLKRIAAESGELPRSEVKEKLSFALAAAGIRSVRVPDEITVSGAGESLQLQADYAKYVPLFAIGSMRIRLGLNFLFDQTSTVKTVLFRGGE